MNTPISIMSIQQLFTDARTHHAWRDWLVADGLLHELVVHAPDQQVDIERAAEFLHRLGFEFSRHRHVEKRPVLEFYLNLYERPELTTDDGVTLATASPRSLNSRSLTH